MENTQRNIKDIIYLSCIIHNGILSQHDNLDELCDNQHNVRKHMSCENKLLISTFDMTHTIKTYCANIRLHAHEGVYDHSFQSAAIYARSYTIRIPQDNLLFLTYYIGCYQYSLLCISNSDDNRYTEKSKSKRTMKNYKYTEIH